MHRSVKLRPVGVGGGGMKRKKDEMGWKQVWNNDRMKFSLSEVVGEQSTLTCTVRRKMMCFVINDAFNNDLESQISLKTMPGAEIRQFRWLGLHAFLPMQRDDMWLEKSDSKRVTDEMSIQLKYIGHFFPAFKTHSFRSAYSFHVFLLHFWMTLGVHIA